MLRDKSLPAGAYYDEKNTEIGNGAAPCAGCSVLETCAAGATALHAAVENGHLDTSVALLKLGAKQTASMQVLVWAVTSISCAL
jgi:hypothetical protein